MKKISIIVPIHNTEKYLSECLDSLLGQTYSNIEIVCVDDYSEDNSRRILQEYAQRDSRIIPIYLERNSGTSYARKIAGMRSTGDYIMFCDSDDKYLPVACETVIREMDSNPVDILHFRSEIIYCRVFDEQKKNSIRSFIEPYLGEICGDLQKECFINKKWEFTLWNKAFRAEACRKAFALASDENFSVATDVYAFFLISYFCKTYRGIPVALNEYRYGAGVTGFQVMNEHQFYKTCEKLISVNQLKPFLDKVCAPDYCYQYAENIRSQIVNGIIYTWFDTVSISDASKCFWYLIKYLSPSELMGILARKYWDNYDEVLARITQKRVHLEPGRKVSRIAVYYSSIRNGGAQKVVAQMVQMLADQGYDVVLVTDEPSSDNDYPISAKVERVILPHYKNTNGSNYHQRAYSWEYLVKTFCIDTVVYHQGIMLSMFWDFCTLKALGVNLIAQLHSVFNSTMWYSPILASYTPYIYQLADRIICLSHTDEVFWNSFGVASCIFNPVNMCPKEQISTLSGKNIVWVGRISAEKQLGKMLEAFSLVRNAVPDATLTIVGDGAEPSLMQNAKKQALSLGIQDGVQFEGFHLDVTPFYRKASVFAMTSKTEGFPLVLAESKTYGLPAVMFDLPWVEFCRDGRGIIAVPQGSVIHLANALIEVLTDTEKRSKLGQQARQSAEDYAAIDYAAQWKAVFESFAHPVERQAKHTNDLVIDCLYSGFQQGLKFITSKKGGSTNVTEAINRYEEAVNRHEEVINRHEEVINRHNDSINHHWEIQKWHEERLRVLEAANSSSFWKRVKRFVKRLLHLG